jgi:hypothetical protein
MSKNQQIAQNIIEKAEEHGFDIFVEDGVFSVGKRFESNNSIQMQDCRKKANEILCMLPTSGPGSTWGSDGIGWQVSLELGHFELHKSGGNKLVLKALAQMLAKQGASLQKRKQIMDRKTPEQMTPEDMKAVFDAYLTPKSRDWRDPINAWVPEEWFDQCKAACEFFTATELKDTGGRCDKGKYGRVLFLASATDEAPVDGLVRFMRVKAAGYRAGPAGP